MNWIRCTQEILTYLLGKISLFVGGADGTGKILDITRGHFQTGFVGCVQNIIVQNIEVSASLDGITGKNVQSCSDVSS